MANVASSVVLIAAFFSGAKAVAAVPAEVATVLTGAVTGAASGRLRTCVTPTAVGDAGGRAEAPLRHPDRGR